MFDRGRIFSECGPHEVRTHFKFILMINFSYCMDFMQVGNL